MLTHNDKDVCNHIQCEYHLQHYQVNSYITIYGLFSNVNQYISQFASRVLPVISKSKIILSSVYPIISEYLHEKQTKQYLH